jgi:hypothetical protein
MRSDMRYKKALGIPIKKNGPGIKMQALLKSNIL